MYCAVLCYAQGTINISRYKGIVIFTFIIFHPKSFITNPLLVHPLFVIYANVFELNLSCIYGIVYI